VCRSADVQGLCVTCLIMCVCVRVCVCVCVCITSALRGGARGHGQTSAHTHSLEENIFCRKRTHSVVREHIL
jgi:hypothetical protein